jgi:hypothetical protein
MLSENHSAKTIIIQFMLKKPTLFLIIVLTGLLPFVAFAQKPVVDGKVSDDRNTPLSFVNVTLLRSSDNKFAAATLTDSAGHFRLEAPSPGNYYLRFSSIGFIENKTDSFTLSGDASRNFGSISLKADAKTLQNVTVESLRPAITLLADRMIVAVEGTAMAAGNTAFSVLAKSPGVFVDNDGNVQLNGRPVAVQVDGRQTYLSARDLKTMLEGMSAENLKNIEIITNPSAKHEAEGAGGIININLKKNTLAGMNGSLNASYNYNWKQQHGYAYGGNINFKKGRWNTFLRLDDSRRVGGRDATFTRVFYYPADTTYFDQVALGTYEVEGPPAIRSGADFTINNNHTVGVMFNFMQNTAKQAFLTETFIGGEPKKYQQFIDADNLSSNTFRNITSNLHYTGKLDSMGTTLTTDLDYVKIKNTGEAFLNNYYTNLSTNQQVSDILYTNTPNGFDIYSARIDLVKPFRNNRKLELGGRVSEINSDNDYKFYFNNSGLVIDPKRTNRFKYSETITAAYFNYAAPISKKFSYQVGLRMEQTRSNPNSITLKYDTSWSYTGFFPSLFLQHTISPNYSINYNFRRSLNRPNYGNLNPFRAYRDPLTWYEGNTGLRPSYTNSFNMIHTIKKMYNFTFTFQDQKDVMNEVPILRGDTTVYTTGNINDAWNTSFSAVAPFKIARKWDTQNTLVVNYNELKMNTTNGTLTNNKAYFYFQSNHTILLPKDFRFEMTFMYRGPATNGLYTMEGVHRVDLAFKKQFFKKKLDVTLNANDIFKGMRYKWSTDINGNVNDFDQYFRLNTVSASLRYNFSRGQKVEDKRRSGTVEEVNRL